MNIAKEMLNFTYEVSHIPRVLQHAVKSYDMEPTALLPLRRKSCYGFLSPLKVLSSLAGTEPANLVSSGKHANT
jgi:hypothetical protein